MSLLEICLIGAGLAMDAFGVSIYKGLVMKDHEAGKKFLLALLFGLFQFLMPILGWIIGGQFASYIDSYAPWVIFLILLYLGINTIRSAGKEEEDQEGDTTSWWEMIMLAIATSIDAMAVGLAFAFMDLDVVYASVWIGLVTFAIALMGIYLGRFMGTFVEKRAEMLGGLVLIFLGIKFLLSGLGLL